MSALDKKQVKKQRLRDEMRSFKRNLREALNILAPLTDEMSNTIVNEEVLSALEIANTMDDERLKTINTTFTKCMKNISINLAQLNIKWAEFTHIRIKLLPFNSREFETFLTQDKLKPATNHCMEVIEKLENTISENYTTTRYHKLIIDMWTKFLQKIDMIGFSMDVGTLPPPRAHLEEPRVEEKSRLVGRSRTLRRSAGLKSILGEEPDEKSDDELDDEPEDTPPIDHNPKAKKCLCCDCVLL